MKPLQQSFGFAPPEESGQPGRRNLVIEASAGTGKTTAIVGQVVNLMLEVADLAPERIVLVTFTEKAAGEIADRIRGALESLRDQLEIAAADGPVNPPTAHWPRDSSAPLVIVDNEEQARRAVAHHLGNIDALRSQTIHSFCQSLLRAYPIEAGLDPQFKIVQGFERSLLYGQLYDAWLDEETRVNPSEDAVKEWELLFAHVGYLFVIRELILELIERRDLLSETGRNFGELQEVVPLMEGALAAIRGSQERAGDEKAERMFGYIRANTPPERDAGIEAWMSYFRPIAASIREVDLPGVKGAVLKDSLKILRVDEKKGSSIQDKLISHRAATALIALTRRFVHFLDREKKKLGVADFDDLLLRTLALLHDEAVLERLRGQFDYIFVDEFQDTDRTQAAIIRRLATDSNGAFVPGKLVIVGDPKQSIYGFRRADPETYHVMTRELLRAGGDERVIEKQYRSDAPLIEVVNAIFSRLFPGQAHDANVFRPTYKAIEAARPGLRREMDARVTLLESVRENPADRHFGEAEAIAEWILANRDRDGTDLRRFAVLFRRLTKLDDYLDTLQRYGIDYVLPPTRMFLDRPAAVDLVAVLRAIAFPFDRGAQISAARTPYFALTDREVLASNETGTTSSPSESSWAAFDTAIEGYREASRHLAVSQLIDLVIDNCAMESLYRAAADGVRHLRHLEHLRSIAFDFDQRSGGSVRQFVEEVQNRRTEPEEMEPALTDETRNAVRIFSVHAAKGLEFETVILPDLAFGLNSGDANQLFAVEEPASLVLTGRAETISANFRKADGERLKKIGQHREEAEMRRLFYVAVTRAMTDVVFVCSPHGKGNNTGFLACLTEVLGVDRKGLAALWPERGREIQVTPIGRVCFEVGATRAAGGELPAAAPARRRLYDATLEAGLLSAELASVQIATPAPVAETLRPGEIAARHAGARNRAAGILLHRVLERWDGTADPEPLLRRLAIEAGVDTDTAALVRNRIATVRRSPMLRRLAEGETIGRELTIHFYEEETLVERRIDRLFREPTGDFVLDYKSGAPEASRVTRDRIQISRYSKAISAITGRPCTALLWYIDLETDEVVTVAE